MKYLTNRQEIAYAMNFGRYPVVRINLETCPPGYDNYYKGDLVKVMAPSKRHPDMYCTGRLYLERYENGKEQIGVLTDSTCLHDSFGYSDVMERLEIAQAPVLHAGDTVVLIEDYPKRRMCKVRMMKARDFVEPHVFPCITLSDVPDDFDTSVPRGW